MDFVGYSSHSFDDTINPIRLQHSSTIRSTVIKEPTNRTRPPEDRRNRELKRLQRIPRLDICNFSMDNKTHEQSAPVDLRKRDPIKLIRTENLMEYAFEPAKQYYASINPFLVHGDFLNECSQVSKILEDLFEDIAVDLDLSNSTGDHVLEEDHFGRINTQNMDEFRGSNLWIRDAVLPIEGNINDTSEGRKIITKFTLPPDYDPNNSKWTLKHRNPGPELTELLPSSGLYVNATELNHCNEVATDCKSLTRLLMMEVFSDSALGVCSLTGGRATCFRGSKINVRPGLDKDARAILVKYVEIYGQKKGWYIDNHRAILITMRNKLSSFRKKSRFRV